MCYRNKQAIETRRLQIMRKPKTPFGIEVTVFCAETGMKKDELAKQAGVNYATMLDVEVGRSAGHELVPKVHAFMFDYRKKAANAALLLAQQQADAI
jgi:hypothetical protein